MGLIGFLLIGAAAGFLAEKVMKQSMGLLGNLLTGIGGAFLGGLLFNFIGGRGMTGFNLYSLVVATVGAIALLWILGKLKKA